MHDVIEVVKALDIPERQKSDMLHLLVIERPYPLGYLPPGMQILTALVFTMGR